MNYFAHGFRFTEDPYFLAGTALPDWLSVVDRGIRVRARQATPFVGHDAPEVASLARGVVQHHADDAWFHTSRAFTELSWHFTVLFRDALPPDEGWRPSFLGHILVEILLDAHLIEQNPEVLEAYYRAMAGLNAPEVQRAVNLMAARPTDRLVEWIPRFIEERFLVDYDSDARLRFRLDQVMRRVRLPELPESFCLVLPRARDEVHQRLAELIPPDPTDPETAALRPVPTTETHP
jgi:hypothetical protein